MAQIHAFLSLPRLNDEAEVAGLLQQHFAQEQREANVLWDDVDA